MFKSKMLIVAPLVLFCIIGASARSCVSVVPQTGQTDSYEDGDDGALQRGLPWPNPRFTDNGDGTVTDNLTQLIWLKDANCIATNYSEFDKDGTLDGDGRITWEHALDFVAGLNDGTYSDCGAGHTDWHLPNVRELNSLIHYGFRNPALPNTAGTDQWSEGDPFTDVQSAHYWSSTTYAGTTVYAWFVGMGYGYVDSDEKDFSHYVWPVRGGCN